MWSVGNEIGEQTQAKGAEILRPLVETCHREDSTRPVTAACDNIFTDRASATPEFLNLLDIVGYNYVDRWGRGAKPFTTMTVMPFRNAKWSARKVPSSAVAAIIRSRAVLVSVLAGAAAVRLIRSVRRVTPCP
jgi:hypothetical protein